MGQTSEEERTRWRGWLAEQKESGQSVAVFCRERGVREWQFYEWRKRLRAKTEPFVAIEERVRALYVIERQGQTATTAERLVLRQEKSAPLLEQLQQLLLRWKEQLLPRHPMAEAIQYALTQWNELTVFATDGAIPIDNNVSEREMKRIVLQRKNSLFVGNPREGRTAAILASLTSTCRRHEIDPQLYLTQLLVNMPSVPRSQLPAWLPDQWKRGQGNL